jgi:hypothetical protein
MQRQRGRNDPKGSPESVHRQRDESNPDGRLDYEGARVDPPITANREYNAAMTMVTVG